MNIMDRHMDQRTCWRKENQMPISHPAKAGVKKQCCLPSGNCSNKYTVDAPSDKASRMWKFSCRSSEAVDYSILILKAPTKIAADNISIFYCYLQKKIRLDFFMWILCLEEDSVHLKHQVLFSLKNNEKIFMSVICCSRDWRFKG